MRVLAGDVGGTNARMALVEVGDGGASIVHRHDFPSAKYSGLALIVREYCAMIRETPAHACVGIPCPISEGSCTLANLSWELELSSFRRETGIPGALLINDFASIGYGIDFVEPKDLITIRAGTPVPRAPIAILGAGTGLGQGALVWHRDHYQVLASEGGHADFAPRTEEEMGLLRFLLRRHRRVSWERVVSGPGLANIYDFLVDAGYAKEKPEVRREMESSDPPAVITTRALEKSDPICDHALDLFVSIYGAQAGNLALIYRAMGGIYLAGGVAPRIAGRLQAGGFLAAFGDKGRLSPTLENIPIHIIAHAAPGILGAARVAANPALLEG